MQYALQNAAPQPTLQHLVRDIEGKRVKSSCSAAW